MLKSAYSFISNQKLNIYFVLFLGICVRVIGISLIPAGLNQDEASIGYEAYSLMQSGMDRNGLSFPIHFIAWGSGQNALYAYLSIPFIKLFGLNVFSVRIVNALFSCLSLVLFYFLFLQFFDKKKSTFATLFLAINPWSIMAARWGLEANIFPTLFLAGVLFILLGISYRRYFFLFASIVFAFSLYSYGISYLSVPLFLLLTSIYLLKAKKISISSFISSFLLFTLISLPIFLFIIINQFDLPPITFLDVSIPKLDANRSAIIFNVFGKDFLFQILKNIVLFLRIIFLQTDENIYNAIPIFGTIYPLSLPFLVVGLWKILSDKTEKKQVIHTIMLIWLFSAVVLGIFTHTNINRINIIFIPLVYFTILGIFHTVEIVPANFQQNARKIIGAYYVVFFLLFISYYSTFHNEKMKNEFSYGLGETISFSHNLDSAKTINISPKSVNMPYIFVAFYTQMDPEIFRKTIVYDESNLNFKHVVQLERYSFTDNTSDNSTIQIVSEEEFIYSKNQFLNFKKFGNFYVCNF